MNRFGERMRIFMLGRYGTDQLSIGLLVLYIITLFLPLGDTISLLISALMIFIYIYRMLSRDIIRRRKENEFFLRFWNPIAATFRRWKNQITDKNNRYFKCSKCHQHIRVPKGKGKICITCPKCKNEFIKKT